MTWCPRTALARILLSGITAATAVSVTAFVPATASPTEVSCNRWQALHVTGIADQPLVAPSGAWLTWLA